MAIMLGVMQGMKLELVLGIRWEIAAGGIMLELMLDIMMGIT